MARDKQSITCDDCFHLGSCMLWCNAISPTAAQRCPQFEPTRYVTVRELYEMTKEDKNREDA